MSMFDTSRKAARGMSRLGLSMPFMTRMLCSHFAQSDMVVGQYSGLTNCQLLGLTAVKLKMIKASMRQPKHRSQISLGQCQASEEACAENFVRLCAQLASTGLGLLLTFGWTSQVVGRFDIVLIEPSPPLHEPLILSLYFKHGWQLHVLQDKSK